MNIEYARSLSYKAMRDLFKSYLFSLDLGRNTIGTFTGDAFYLWNNEGKEQFWNVVTSDHFEEDARNALTDALSRHSTGNVPALINGYVASLRRFHAFVYDEKNQPIPQKDDMTALKEFLLDIECLDPLVEWTSKFNLFDILKITRTEIRHSNMLSWLINPNENHGLGDSVIRGIIQFVTTGTDDDVFENLLMDCKSFEVFREWHHIDILAVSEQERFLLCIENKIDSGEHDNQLWRYKRQLDETYPDFKKMMVFLSPDGSESSDPENWYAMGYQDILAIVENAKARTKLLPESTLLIENYLDSIRRDIVGDEKLQRICAEIYAKHQKALDLIFENKPNKSTIIADILRTWAIAKSDEGLIQFVPDKSNNTFIRFKTSTMSEILPDAPYAQSGWNTANYYFYEIRNNAGNEVHIHLALSSKEIPDNLRAICDKINDFYPSRTNKANWQWRTPFVTKHIKIEEEFSEEKIFVQLDKRLEEVFAFESKLKDLLASN